MGPMSKRRGIWRGGPLCGPRPLPSRGRAASAWVAVRPWRRAGCGAARIGAALRCVWSAPIACTPCVLTKDAADRLEQEEVLSRLALEAIVEACGGPVAGASLPDYAHLARRELALDDPLGLLFAGELDVVEMRSDGVVAPEVERGQRLFLSGSFNPLHEGHEQLVTAAGQLSGRRPSLELSVSKMSISRPCRGARLSGVWRRCAVAFPW